MGSVIGFAGLSHLGLVSSVAAAAQGFRVIAFDARRDLVASLQAGSMPIHEPGLDELRNRQADRLRFTSSSAELQACDVVVVAIDIATDDANQSDLTALNALVDCVARELSAETVLVILSQVPPGYMRQLARRLAPTLAAKNIQLHYQVETLIFGRALERASHPERLIVGCSEPSAPLPSAFRGFLESFGCPILPMRYESAELTKIAINVFLVASVTATNTLAGICEAIHADWSEIAPALRLDKRIGPHAYLAPGLGLAGGNLERDLATVNGLAAEHGVEAGIIGAFQTNSQYRRDWALRSLHAHLDVPATKGPAPAIAVWGLAYKENTHATKNSPALALIEALSGFTIRACDPQVTLTMAGRVPIKHCSTPMETCRDADALVIMTPWPEFREVDLAGVAAVMKGRLLIDPFGSVSARHPERHGFAYFRLGIPPTEAARSEPAIDWRPQRSVA